MIALILYLIGVGVGLCTEVTFGDDPIPLWAEIGLAVLWPVVATAFVVFTVYKRVVG